MSGGSQVLQGIGVSPGVAFGPALIVRLDVPDVPNRGIAPDQVEAEVARLHQAVAAVVETLSALRDRVLHRAGREESHIFDAQIMMVQDADVIWGRRAADPAEQVERRDGVRVQGAGDSRTVGRFRKRHAARPAGRSLRHPDPGTPAVAGPAGRRPVAAAGRRAGDRGGPRAVARDSRCSWIATMCSGWSAKKAPVPRTPRSWPTRSVLPAVMGAAGALERITNGTTLSDRRAERNHPGGSRPGSSSSGLASSSPGARSSSSSSKRESPSRPSRPTVSR